MLKTTPVALTLLGLVCTVAPTTATEYFDLGLHGRVQAADTVVLVRVTDAARAIVDVERTLKGEPPKKITLVDYVDGYLVPEQRKPLVAGARELLFLTKKGNAYAPVQNQYGRMTVSSDQVTDSFRRETRSLPQTVASIQRLVMLQARAAHGDSEADQAYVAAFASADPEVRKWALGTSFRRIKIPSAALSDAVIEYWKRDTDTVPDTWPNDIGLVANAVVTWRLKQAAPAFAESLKTSANGYRRAFSAMALGGTGDLTYLPLLRGVSSRDADAYARALAYNGIMYMLGPDSLSDLRRGAKDADEQVRAQVVVDSYNLLELEGSDRRWPPPSGALIADVHNFLTEMQRDPARLVSDNAKSMLAMIARHRQ